ncbi:MAG: hypothetical protein QOJ13_401 [Gaiellales bacterium]|nr:hypothetical protein [Gaiellales bacterium]
MAAGVKSGTWSCPRSAPPTVEVRRTSRLSRRNRLLSVIAATVTLGSVGATAAGASGNVLANPSFEGGVSGWGKTNAVLASITGAVDGTMAARASRSGTATSYSIYPSPVAVSSTVAGVSYTATAWVRSSTTAENVCIILREKTPAGSNVSSSSTCVRTTTTWQQIPPVSYVTKAAGNSLNLLLSQASASTGDSFDADAVNLMSTDATGPPAPTLTSTPPNPTTATSATFGFTDAQSGVTFDCRVDGAAPSSCTSPTSYTGLAPTTHTFAVRATDPASGLTSAATQFTWTVQGASDDPVIAAVGDIACSPNDPNFNGGLGVGNACRQGQVASLISSDASIDKVLALGDNQYDCASLSDFLGGYDLQWGAFKAITAPVPGNHEYKSTNPDAYGQSVCGAGAQGYFSYFGANAHQSTNGYYSFDLGSWHIIALNSSNACSPVACAVGSPQEQWLKNDLATHASACTLAYWHAPRFTSGSERNNAKYAAFWQDLYAAGADVVLNGHVHSYERFVPQNPAEQADPMRGITEFVVGTGGKSHGTFITPPQPTSAVRNNKTYGVVKLTLHPNSFDWRFVPVSGQTFADSGTNTCH